MKSTTDSKEPFDLYFYSIEGHKLKYNINENYITVKYSENVSEEEINQLNSSYGLSKEPLFWRIGDYNSLYTLKIPFGHEAEEYYTLYGNFIKDRFGNEPLVQYANPVLEPLYRINVYELLTDEIYIYFREDVEIGFIESIINEYKLLYKSTSPFFNSRFKFQLTKESPKDVFGIVNSIYEKYFDKFIYYVGPITYSSYNKF